MKNPIIEDKHSTKILYVGLDVHKESIAVAIAEEGRGGEVRRYGTISGDLHAVEKLMTKLRKTHGIPGSALRVVYEAGPCGFVVYRRLKQLGIACEVVAPSLVPKRAGDKIKTDRRDALKLARLHRAGELTAITVPEERDEAIRDLCRARTDAVNDQRRCRQQLKAFLLRQGYKYSGKSSWNEAHLRYLRELVLPHAAHKAVLEECILAVCQAAERVERITGLIETHYQSWERKRQCEALMALKGIQLLSAVTFLSEIGAIERFAHPRALMAFLGLIPSEYSSSETIRQGAITKCGNHHVRWFLVESAQHYALPPKTSKQLSLRQKKVSQRIKEISWSAQNRLHRRFYALQARGKTRPKAITAIARELLGFIWAVLQEQRAPGSVVRRTPLAPKRIYRMRPMPRSLAQADV